MQCAMQHPNMCDDVFTDAPVGVRNPMLQERACSVADFVRLSINAADTAGPVKIQTSASDFWGKQMHQTRARIPQKYLKRAEI
jgi:hypothetical protein